LMGSRCIKCGSCLRACPVLNDPSGSEFPGPRTAGVDAPRFNEKSSIGNRALICTMCHSCEWACPSSIALTRSMMMLRNDLVGDILPGHRRMRDNVNSHGHTVEVEFQGWVEKGNPVLYFPGCIGLGRAVDMTKAASSLLGSLGIGHDISNQALCCGSPLLKVGAVGEAQGLQAHNLKVFSEYDEVITSCPGCTYQLRTVYGIEAKHMVEVLDGKDLISNVTGRWALQVPCHLKRGLGPWTAERLVNILETAGVDLVRIPEEDVCCGGGGGLMSGFPETAGSMASNKASTYRDANVDGVITACPFCTINLRRQGIRVLDVAEAVTPRN